MLKNEFINFRVLNYCVKQWCDDKIINDIPHQGTSAITLITNPAKHILLFIPKHKMLSLQITQLNHSLIMETTFTKHTTHNINI
jgi:hypothetical protein